MDRGKIGMGDEEVVVIAGVEDPLDVENRPIHRHHSEIGQHRNDRGAHGHPCSLVKGVPS